MQLVVYILLSTLMTAVAFAAPFHHDLGELTGIGAPRIDSLMILLSALYLALGLLEWIRKKRHWPET